MKPPRGFSLVELVITIVVLGIIAVAAGAFLLPAFNAQQGLERRAALVEAAESAIRRMSRDIRISVPNSVRVTNALAVGSGFAIELIPTVDGGRYCTAGTANCDVTGPPAILAIGAPDNEFEILGLFHNTAFIAASGGSAYRLVAGSIDSTLYAATGATAVITPVGTITLSVNSGRHRVTLGAAHNFPTASPRQRVFVVEDAAAPVTYICNHTAGTLRRYAGYKNGAAYSSSPNQPTAPAVLTGFGATDRLVADNVSNCSVTSVEANVQTSGVVTLSLTLSSSGEMVQLLNQVQLDNSQ